MTEPMLSVCWKNHTSELATVYQSLLENNFLVDCTLSAEGRSLRAHRLVLSACSPYFHKLFHEETGKHPFVVLLNASFETLKAVIDFVYKGEAQISTVGLKEFLTLAQYLRIKGLNAFTQEYVNKIVSRNSTGNVYIPSEDNQDAQEVQDVSGSRKNNLEYSSQPHPHLSGSFADTVHTHSSVPFEAYSASCEEEQSVMPPQEHQRPVGCNEMSEDTEVTVKHEPFFSAYSETRNKKVDNIKQSESISESYMSEMDGGSTFVTGEEDLHQYPIKPDYLV
ncbi:Uncharacterized protein GBIM_14226 [Gryllus bimaculatus]|nr:Uncharacterized protein GBIM_14226 [Gryllus bimaculatus]